MKDRKKETFIYEGLGFPIKLVNVPMRKMLGYWCIDINMNKLMLDVLEALIHKPYPLTGKEIRFMRKFLEMPTTEFGENLGITHATVVKWEKNQAKVSPMQETCIRMFLFESLKDQELIPNVKDPVVRVPQTGPMLLTWPRLRHSKRGALTQPRTIL